MSKESVREAIKIRISHKKKQDDESAIAIQEINTTLQKYTELSDLEKDFAFRSSIENRTVYEWADYYHVSYFTIRRMIQNIGVKALKTEIQTNIRKYVIGMQLYLLRRAMSQYLEIFVVRTTGDTIESKRKAAKDILSTFNLAVDPDSGQLRRDKGNAPMNVNIFNDKNDPTKSNNENIDAEKEMRSVSDIGSLEDLEKEMNELKELSVMNNLITEYDKKHKKSENSSLSFNENAAKDIIVE